eukprot:gene4316-6624_t
MGSKERRSDVNELRTLIRTPEVQKDPARYREAVEKVILYMTLGVDVSRLFSEIVLASATRDLVQKKLVYLYLCNYAESNSELALLTVNTLQKDCRDSNPVIRGLALRSMCNLRVPNLVEYLIIPLRNGLADTSAYVRKTAIMGCLKLFYLDQQAVDGQMHSMPVLLVERSGLNIDYNNIPDALYSMLSDRDSQVVADTVIALEEILASQGGIILTKEVAYMLLNRLADFTEWNQCAVMNVLLRYTPQDEEEIFDILNILDDRLKHTNTGVVLVSIACNCMFKSLGDLHDDIYERLKTPLITLMAASGAEVSHTVLHHIHLLVKRRPHIFAGDFKALFARFTDPAYVKAKKLMILTDISDENNSEKIIEELTAYVTDIDIEMARRAVRAVGRIAIRLPSVIDSIITALLAFLELRSSYLTAETLVVMRDILRRYPEQADTLVPQLYDLIDLPSLDDEADARAALVWMMGEFGELIEESPYVLEGLIDDISTEKSADVRLQLLTSTVKLFFKRPPEVQKMLGRLLDSVISNEMHQDVHDRALLYYRLLSTNHQEAQRIISGRRHTVTEFVLFEPESNEAVFNEFNTLSVMYGQPLRKMCLCMAHILSILNVSAQAKQFILQEHPYNLFGNPDIILEQGEDSSEEEDDENDVGNSTLAPSTGKQDSHFKNSMHLRLVRRPTLSPQQFEQYWLGLDICTVVKDVLQEVPTASTPTHIEKAMSRYGIVLMASSPPLAGQIKFFFYGQEQDSGDFHLVEANLDISSRTLSASVKSVNGDTAPMFGMVLREALSDAGLISMDLI